MASKDIDWTRPPDEVGRSITELLRRRERDERIWVAVAVAFSVLVLGFGGWTWTEDAWNFAPILLIVPALVAMLAWRGAKAMWSVLRPHGEDLVWEPLENMSPPRRFVANWTVFIVAGIALVALLLGVAR